MATSNSLEAFDRRMRVIAGNLGTGAEIAVRRAAIAADQVAVVATPVDTGRARGAWFVSIGSPIFDANEDGRTGQTAISEGQSVAGSWQLGNGPVFISNSVPYIIPLDTGSSDQAPNGMSQLAIQAAARQLNNFRILTEGGLR